MTHPATIRFIANGLYYMADADAWHIWSHGQSFGDNGEDCTLPEGAYQVPDPYLQNDAPILR